MMSFLVILGYGIVHQEAHSLCHWPLWTSELFSIFPSTLVFLMAESSISQALMNGRQSISEQ